MDSKYSTYLEFYCTNKLSDFINELRKERNEYLFSSSYLYNQVHKGKYSLQIIITVAIIKILMVSHIYLTGQKIATKIKTLNADTLSNINKLISNYNQTKELLLPSQGEKYPTASIENILNDQSEFWMTLDIVLDENCHVPRIIMYNAIQNHNNFNRSKEEQDLVKSEITRLTIFWDKQKKLVEKAVEDYKVQETRVDK
jgi:hypothetical protein